MPEKRSLSRGARVVRGLTVACLSVVVAAFSHVAGGGVAPGVLGTTLALTFAILACIALGSKTLSPVRLTLSVVLSQVVFHVLFSLGADLPAAASGHSVGMLGMVMSGGHTITLPDLGSGHDAAVETMSDARMWVGHAVAALLTIAILLHGERSLLVVMRIAGARLARLAVVVDALPHALGVARHRVDTSVSDRRGLQPLDVLLITRPHRGPPLVA